MLVRLCDYGVQRRVIGSFIKFHTICGRRRGRGESRSECRFILGGNGVLDNEGSSVIFVLLT